MNGSENISMMPSTTQSAHPVGIAADKTQPIPDFVVNKSSAYDGPLFDIISLVFVVLSSNKCSWESRLLNFKSVKFFSASVDIIFDTTVPFWIFKALDDLEFLYSLLSQSLKTNSMYNL